MNPIYQQMNNQNPYEILIRQLNEFSKTIKGNPQEQVQQLLNSGKVTQVQYNQAVQKANTIKHMMRHMIGIK